MIVFKATVNGIKLFSIETKRPQTRVRTAFDFFDYDDEFFFCVLFRVEFELYLVDKFIIFSYDKQDLTIKYLIFCRIEIHYDSYVSALSIHKIYENTETR